MFGIGFTGGSPATFYSNTMTTNVVVSCQQGNFYGFTADLVYDSSKISVSVAGLSGVTLTQGSRLVADTAGMKPGNVLKLTVTRKGLSDGQSTDIKIANAKGTCDGGTSTSSATKTIKYVKPAPVETKPEEPEVTEPEPDLNAMSANELLAMVNKDLTPEKLEEIKTALVRLIGEQDSRVKVLESQLAEAEQSLSPLGESEEKTGIARVIDNKWAFFGVGAFMATLIAAAIAIIKSLVSSSRSSKAAPTKRSEKQQQH